MHRQVNLPFVSPIQSYAIPLLFLVSRSDIAGRQLQHFRYMTMTTTTRGARSPLRGSGRAQILNGFQAKGVIT